jgi:hypothetical protein
MKSGVKMKIFIKSNFVVPGLEEKEWIEMDRPEITLREFLEALAERSPDPLIYVEPGADRLDPDDWEIDINDVPYQDFDEGLENSLRDRDVLTIRVLAQGGG